MKNFYRKAFRTAMSFSAGGACAPRAMFLFPGFAGIIWHRAAERSIHLRIAWPLESRSGGL